MNLSKENQIENLRLIRRKEVQTNTTDSVIVDTSPRDSILHTDTSQNFPGTVPENSYAIFIKGIPVDGLMKKNHKLTGSSTAFDVPFGVKMDGSPMQVTVENVSDIKVQERIQTSMYVMNDGPACLLRNWKHHNSEWKDLPVNANGDFQMLVY